jgi:MarR family transcriptional regulator, transcriptional regulator for hemolysin
MGLLREGLLTFLLRRINHCIIFSKLTTFIKTMTKPSAAVARQQNRMAFGATLQVMARAYKAAADKAVGHIGLSQAMAWPLVMIGRLGNGIRPGMLADVLAIESASLVRQLDQLAEAGLVDRREDTIDRRAKTLHLTPAGTRARAKIEASLDAMRAEMFDGIADADLEACLRVFAALDARLGRPARPLLPGMAPASVE